jgi:hypothetical protein
LTTHEPPSGVTSISAELLDSQVTAPDAQEGAFAFDDEQRAGLDVGRFRGLDGERCRCRSVIAAAACEDGGQRDR